MKRFFSHIFSAISGMWLSSKVVPGVVIAKSAQMNFFGLYLTKNWQILLLTGIILGLLNYFARPFLKNFDLPLKKVTFQVITLIFIAGFLWVLSMLFSQLNFPLFLPLFYSALIIWLINITTQKLVNVKKI
jgi:uncharacterized membrane protein YvlD (DUF360 family)